MTHPPAKPHRRRQFQGKRVLLILLVGMILLLAGLYAVIIPMHFGGKERIQLDHGQHKQVQPDEPSSE